MEVIRAGWVGFDKVRVVLVLGLSRYARSIPRYTSIAIYEEHIAIIPRYIVLLQ